MTMLCSENRPKSGKGGLTGFLGDYVVAERIGHANNQSCEESFPRCPTSIFGAFGSPKSDNNVVPEIPVTEEPLEEDMHHQREPAPINDQLENGVRLNSRKAVDKSRLMQFDHDVSVWTHPFGGNNHV